jgi:S-(hydroxymethyl)glutathione dehydrogenase/alcohol dehydrogenase
LHWVPACGQCFWCLRDQPELCEAANYGAVHGALPARRTPLSWRGAPAYAFSLTGTLAGYAVVPQAGLTTLPADIPWDEAALLGCAVLTGTGAAFRAPLHGYDDVLVIGLGGVGQAIVQGARIAGAGRIIAVDPVAFKRAVARETGATMVVDPTVVDPLEVVLDATDGRGVDVAFEAVGRPDLLALAFNAVRKGGTAVAVGVPAPNEEVALNAFAFPSQEKTLTGSWYGGAHPTTDVPRLVDLWRRGALQLRPLLTRSYTLAEAADAVRDLEAGKVIRGAVWLSDPP